MNKPLNLKATGTAVAFALAAFAGNASAGVPGYVTNAQDQVWTSPYGLCWRTSSWSPQYAAAPCDAVPRAEVQVPVLVAAVPKPEPAPLVVVAPPPPPVIERVALSADVLFPFDKADLLPEGKEELNALARRLKDAQVASTLVVGFADPIGPEPYNQKLSAARADSVKDYLAQQGLDRNDIRIEGRGETRQFTEGKCKGLSGAALIACFQPNRRVEIEVRGTRQAAAPGAPAGAGATGPAGSGASAAGGSGAPK